MSKRVGLKSVSSRLLTLRCTEDEEESHKALAAYLGETWAAMIRRLVDQERRRLVGEGKRPPLRMRE